MVSAGYELVHQVGNLGSFVLLEKMTSAFNGDMRLILGSWDQFLERFEAASGHGV
jgi:hypothetical protein